LLAEPLFIRPEDSGTDESPTVIEAAPGEQPVLSGGVAIHDWKRPGRSMPGLPEAAAGKVWVADAPRWGGQTLRFRQLWVNGSKAVRARDADTDDEMSRILSVDTRRQEIWIPASKRLSQLIAASKPSPAGQMEMIIHQMWAIAILRIKDFQRVGDSVRLRFYEPEAHLEFEHPWPAPVIDRDHKKNGNSAFYLVNALELLDRPGEWYADVLSGKVYYWPRPGEDLATAQVVAPALETLLKMEGLADRPVENVQCNGLSFAYSTWMRPSESGHVPLQAGMFLLDAYKLRIPGTPDKRSLENQAWIGRPPSAVSIAFSHHVLFAHCRFLHLASSGLDLVRGASDDRIDACLFSDIGGTGIQAGIYSDPGFETHLPYDPADRREYCREDSITNNRVTDCANEDWGCLGISAGYVQDIRIEHNEVNEVSYSGIALGWGWTKTVNVMRNNAIFANHVHHYARHMYDVGGIYTLSAQPGTQISENYVDSIYHPPYAHDPDHWFYFYFDEGSSYMTIRDNWCPEPKFMKNANGPGNTWENNGPMVSDRIRQAAGPLVPVGPRTPPRSPEAPSN
jgi:glycosyl hydrolase family 141